MAGHVLVLNAGYEPLHKVTRHHAINMLIRQVARIEEAVEGETIGPFPMPRVLVLLRYVQMKWAHRRGEPAWSKRGVHRRDGRCAYCKTGKPETIDHITPQSRNGKSTWLNTVSACFKCNQRKADKTPAEAGMRLLIQPRVPSFSEVLAW